VADLRNTSDKLPHFAVDISMEIHLAVVAIVKYYPQYRVPPYVNCCNRL